MYIYVYMYIYICDAYEASAQLSLRLHSCKPACKREAVLERGWNQAGTSMRFPYEPWSKLLV